MKFDVLVALDGLGLGGATQPLAHVLSEPSGFRIACSSLADLFRRRVSLSRRRSRDLIPFGLGNGHRYARSFYRPVLQACSDPLGNPPTFFGLCGSRRLSLVSLQKNRSAFCQTHDLV